MWFDARAALLEIQAATQQDVVPRALPQVLKPWSRVAQVARVAQSSDTGWEGLADHAPTRPRGFRQGVVPQEYFSAWVDFQARAPDGASPLSWAMAVQDGQRFLALFGALAAELDWPAVELFEWRSDWVCGLIWELKGREVVELTRNTALFSANDTQGLACFSRPIPSSRFICMGSDSSVDKT